jgi:hypothetical protein
MCEVRSFLSTFAPLIKTKKERRKRLDYTGAKTYFMSLPVPNLYLY